MYHHTISYQVAMEKQRDMIAEANRELWSTAAAPPLQPS
jgi:hypothetical protein